MNTDWNHVDSQLNATTLTEEEELLVERLVDGELSESERASLLFRLDETVDGWRFCALSFLEAQAFRAAMRDSTGAESPLPLAEALETAPSADPAAPRANVKTKKPGVGLRKTLNLLATTAAGFLLGFVAISDAPHSDFRRITFSCSAPPKVSRESVPTAIAESETFDAAEDSGASSSDEAFFAASTLEKQGRQVAKRAFDPIAEREPEAAPADDSLNATFNSDAELSQADALQATDDATNPNQATVASNPEVQAFRIDDADQIFNSATGATFAQNDQTLGGGAMGGAMGGMPGGAEGMRSISAPNAAQTLKSQPRAFASKMGAAGSGAEFALDASRRKNSAVRRSPTASESNDLNVVVQSDEIAANALESVPSSAPSPARDDAMSQLVASGAVKTARLSSPSRGLSNVVVPFAEADSYDSAKSRAFFAANSNVPTEVADHLRNVGGRLESNRTQYRFPLADGRTLILPVDNYTVSYDEDQPIW